MLITALLMAGALTAGDPDGVVATAPATAVDLGATAQPVAPSVAGAAQAGVPHNLTTDEQITNQPHQTIMARRRSPTRPPAGDRSRWPGIDGRCTFGPPRFGGTLYGGGGRLPGQVT